ncbi:hypothetical protein GGX14DRAFT_658326 [Mycena pura]|uniref:Uncharacterized protein n=1 Tax=Mycena pura TaxID=153505 RepID=A0AAD6YM73_9AGAR|nr:hypothetical protein GGX14DRAFT_658326 [Mycena pura]
MPRRDVVDEAREGHSCAAREEVVWNARACSVRRPWTAQSQRGVREGRHADAGVAQGAACTVCTVGCACGRRRACSGRHAACGDGTGGVIAAGVCSGRVQRAARATSSGQRAYEAAGSVRQARRADLTLRRRVRRERAAGGGSSVSPPRPASRAGAGVGLQCSIYSSQGKVHGDAWVLGSTAWGSASSDLDLPTRGSRMASVAVIRQCGTA